MHSEADQTAQAGVRPPWRANSGAKGPILLICEHASRHIPAEFNGLGLDEQAQAAHIAWDIGARDLALALARKLNAPLIAAENSRLVYDCNRPPEAPDAAPAESEAFAIPGNRDLHAAAFAARVDRIYRPFERMIADTLDARAFAAVVTVHSFTPVFNGAPRAVDIGLLHDADAALADFMLDDAARWAGDLRVARNAPYGPQDGVTHTLRRHAAPRGLPSLMLEIRNDLIANPADAAAMAERLAAPIAAAVEAVADVPQPLRGAYAGKS